MAIFFCLNVNFLKWNVLIFIPGTREGMLSDDQDP